MDPKQAPPRASPKVILRAPGYLRSYRLESFVALISLLLVSAANLAAPQLVRIAIDQGLSGHQERTVLYAVGGLIAIALARGLSTSCRATSPSAPRKAWRSICAKACSPESSA